MQSKEYEVEIGGKKITAIFSDLANQANGSVILKSEGTVVMATAVISKDGSKNMNQKFRLELKERIKKSNIKGSA